MDLAPVPEHIDDHPVQAYGARLALRSYLDGRKGFLIGDERGAGKTFTAIRFATSIPDFKIILCQSSLLLMWKDALIKYGIHPDRIKVCKQSKWLMSNIAKCQPDTYLILSQSIISKCYSFLAQKCLATPTVFILDEAHTFRSVGSENAMSKVATAMFGSAYPYAQSSLKGLWVPARFTLQLTGSIMPNGRHKELYNILRCNLHGTDLWNQRWDNYYNFVPLFCGGGTHFGAVVDTECTNVGEFKKLLAACSVLHEKKEVEETPGIVRRKIRLLADNTLSNWQNEAATELGISSRDIQILEKMVIQRVGKRTDIPLPLATLQERIAMWKVPRTAEHVDAILTAEPNSPVVVFGRHMKAIKLLTEHLGKKWRVANIIGDTKIEDRNAIVKRFQDGKIDVLIGGYVPMGTGLTLTRSRRIVLMELSWVPADIDQAEGRCDRMGQKEVVIVDWVLADKTIDWVLAGTVEKKLKDIETTLGETRELLNLENDLPTRARTVNIEDPINVTKGNMQPPVVGEIAEKVLALLSDGIDPIIVPDLFYDLSRSEKARKFINYLEREGRLVA